MVSTVRGEFTEYTATALFDPGNPATLAVEARRGLHSPCVCGTFFHLHLPNRHSEGDKNHTLYEQADAVRMCGKYRVALENNSINYGGNLASGIYFARLDAGEFSQTRKLMLLK